MGLVEEHRLHWPRGELRYDCNKSNSWTGRPPVWLQPAWYSVSLSEIMLKITQWSGRSGSNDDLWLDISVLELYPQSELCFGNRQVSLCLLWNSRGSKKVGIECNNLLILCDRYYIENSKKKISCGRLSNMWHISKSGQRQGKTVEVVQHCWVIAAVGYYCRALGALFKMTIYKNSSFAHSAPQCF